MLIGAVVAAVAHLVLVEIKLPGVVKEAAVVLLGTGSVCQEASAEWNDQTTQRRVPYRLVRNSVVVVVLVAGVSLAIFVKVFLSRVGKAGTVILK